nr:hypothetical protein [Calothrix sp. PCC 7507]
MHFAFLIPPQQDASPGFPLQHHLDVTTLAMTNRPVFLFICAIAATNRA